MIRTCIKGFLDSLIQRHFCQGKKIGKRTILRTVFFGTFLTGTYSFSEKVEVLSQQRVPLTSIAVGRPFLVRLSHTNDSSPKTDVTGIEAVNVLGYEREFNERMLQGKKITQSFTTYTVTADTPGSYRFGNPPVTVTVIEQDKKNVSTHKDARFTVFLGKTTAYVGEKVPINLRFSWDQPDVSLLYLEPPAKSSKLSVAMGEKETGTVSTDDARSHFIEWRGSLYPKEKGTIRIPRLQAVYSIPDNQRAPFPFMTVRQRYSAYSSANSLTVKPLPKTDKEVLGVGVFRRFSATLSQEEIEQGDAVTLTLRLDGDTDFTALKSPTLVLPESIKHYSSSTTADIDHCSWSIILQPLEEGIFMLAPQKITLFDTEKNEYVTLQTDSLRLHVQPKPPTKSMVVEPLFPEPEEEKNGSQEIVAGLTVPRLATSLFIFLLLFPLLLRAAYSLFVYFKPYVERWQRKRYSAGALSYAESQIEKNNDEDHYAIVRNALLRYWQADTSADLMHVIDEQPFDPSIKKTVKSEIAEILSYSSYTSSTASQSESERKKRTIRFLHMIRGLSLVLIFFMSSPLQAAGHHVVVDFLGMVPFIVWQFGVLLGWWFLLLWSRPIPSEVRVLIYVVWFTFIMGWVLRVQPEYRPKGVIINGTELYIGPSKEYPIRAHLSHGQQIVLVKKVGAWYAISSLDGTGWVPAENISLKE